MRAVCLTVLLAFSSAAADETKLGSGVTLEKATPIATVLATPEAFLGKTIRIDGIATAVCTQSGCRMAVAADRHPDAPTVRLDVDDGAIVFPFSAKGKQVSAEGVFEAVKDAASNETAREHAGHDARASKQYQIRAAGAIIR